MPALGVKNLNANELLIAHFSLRMSNLRECVRVPGRELMNLLSVCVCFESAKAKINRAHPSKALHDVNYRTHPVTGPGNPRDPEWRKPLQAGEI